ncbi:MAG: Uncharacterized protein XD66_1589 [Thermacetogenium phaeum]|jgi:hypothetical protein|uniref:Uncharacterized protein n=1 Tax=Thermacetogenium phaeum TaxID=85874 RepID=A0A101FES7_9THEO|nr:MAG: Uncharacterized protein XD66_1589 [Thermacetogenium phaeum]
MREINIDLGPSIGTGDIEIIKAATSKLAPGDHLLLHLEAADAHETDRILSLLEKENLDYRTHGSHSGRHFTIVATPREKKQEGH